ncbi:MAG: prepilin-type N-terminal cleavage/methylation domain-containing protein [Alphaproteobacteria bacterium]|nr:prepilin-type N-terminal cleavage/methylation domain-containing protein [Alphaproteobacteria bacterium]
MKTLDTQKGFTLVELAIVMTIIGLLIGGILKGQELMENARVTSTVAQVKAYEAAVTSFRDEYQSYPGDMSDANTRIVGCTTTCNAPATSAGNNIVGSPTWSGTGTTAGTYAVQGTGTTVAAPAVGDETWLFWLHLLKANLIGGVTDEDMTATTAYTFGKTHPQAKIAGGFVVGYGNGSIAPGSSATQGTGLNGTVIALTLNPAAALSTTVASLPLTPLRAAQIDRKMDDGRPNTGTVVGYGPAAAAACFTAAAADTTYAENVGVKNCGLLIKIEN